VVFQQWEKNVKIFGIVVFRQWGGEKCEKLLNSGVSTMGEECENLLNSGVSAMGKERREIVEQWCFSTREREKSC
jgi:hypothetical protein